MKRNTDKKATSIQNSVDDKLSQEEQKERWFRNSLKTANEKFVHTLKRLAK